MSEQQHLSWAKTGTLTPIAFDKMAGKISAQVYINKKSELDLSKPVLLDGLSTLERVCLSSPWARAFWSALSYPDA